MTRLAILAGLVALYAGAVVVFLSRPAASQPITCANRDHLAAFLRVEHDLALHSWGLSDVGDMMELFVNDRGHWGVVTTKPTGCAMLSMPHKERGRLWFPPTHNDVLPPARRMNEGSPS
jgi:hypothetical protein